MRTFIPVQPFQLANRRIVVPNSSPFGKHSLCHYPMRILLTITIIFHNFSPSSCCVFVTGRLKCGGIASFSNSSISQLLPIKANVVNAPADIQAPFKVLSYDNAPVVQQWMSADKSNFGLIRWQLQSNPTTVLHCLDIGGNMGFYSFYMASLGCSVSYFEIQSQLVALAFRAASLNNLQQKVRIHHAGLSDEIANLTISGSGGIAFLKSGNGGELVTVYRGTDCLRDLTYSVVKIDDEGFEMKTLKGISIIVQNGKVETLLIEIGPGRWGRANMNISEGFDILRGVLGSYFAYVIVRGEGSCPDNFSTEKTEIHLSGKEVLKQISWDRMHSILTTMSQKGSDCNFWFSMKDLVVMNQTHPIQVL